MVSILYMVRFRSYW